jgi:hypothetical protein
MRRRFVLPALLLTAVALTATTVVPMSVEELTHRSSHVVRARATESWAQWNSDHSMIHTYTRLQVVDRWKGAGPDSVVVKQPGGTAEGYTQRVAGVRQFTSGEEAVLFLRPSDARDGSMVVTGLIQGNFRLYRATSGEVTATNGVPGVNELQTGSVTHYHGQRMNVGELRERVQRAVVP